MTVWVSDQRLPPHFQTVIPGLHCSKRGSGVFGVIEEVRGKYKEDKGQKTLAKHSTAFPRPSNKKARRLRADRPVFSLAHLGFLLS
jgi:hypothetical protein